VAAQLDLQHRNNDVRLLAGGVVMAPGSNPSMLGIAADIPPDGRAVLYVQIRQALNRDYLNRDYPVWKPGETVERLERHRQFFAFERESFDAHSPDRQGCVLTDGSGESVNRTTERVVRGENANDEDRAARTDEDQAARTGEDQDEDQDEDQSAGDQEQTRPPAHRPVKVIPHWDEAMEVAGKQRAHNPAIAGTAVEMRSVKTWLSDRGIYIVDSNDENKKKAELNPTLHPYSDRQLLRRIEDHFKDHPDRS
jgi:hypothetical protein